MIEEYRIEEATVMLRVARYLLVMADKRGMTHGEKHHVIFVAISLVSEAQFILKDEAHSVLTHNDYQELKLSDIPF